MKPEVKTKKFLDWVELKPYLKKKYPMLKLDKIISIFADGGDFCNGCFKSVENPEGNEGMWEVDIEALAAVLFKEFPDAVADDGDIDLYLWW